MAKIGDGGTIRTCDRLLRRQMLYPAELRDPLDFGGANIKLTVYPTKIKEDIFLCCVNLDASWPLERNVIFFTFDDTKSLSHGMCHHIL